MHSAISRGRGATTLALLGTASFLTIAGTVAAQAQANAPAVEEVLVTGSLIRGAPAVGVPVSALSQEDFSESGSVTVSDMLRTLPNVEVSVNMSVTANGGVVQKPQDVAIRGLSTTAGSESLMMIDGMRFPIQGFSIEYIDPSIIAPLGVQRIDVLAEGASATYGSDAIAGVINVILRRGFSGATSQVRYSQSWDVGADSWTLDQLYGRPWDSGQVTVAFQWNHQDNVHGRQRDYITLNYEPYGFDDRRPFGASMPATISAGASRAIAGVDANVFDRRVGTRICANCFSIPAGTGWDYGDTPAHTNPTAPGSAPTTTWAAIQGNPGVTNLHDPSEIADILSAIQNSRASITFDQKVADDVFGVFQNVNFFVDGIYSNHNTAGFYIAGASPGREQAIREIVPPTTNPYYPAGAPANLRVSYDLAYEIPVRVLTNAVSDRYAFGFESDLPYDWRGKLYYSKSEDKNYVHATGMVNTNHLNAALGLTVQPTAPGQGAYTKPASVPYFNIFCDSTVHQCNSPITLDYIRSIRFYDEWYNIAETGLNLDGSVFDLPGGTVKAAVGASIRSDHYNRVDTVNYNQYDTNVFSNPREGYHKQTWAVFGQVDVPIVGEANKVPLVQGFDIQLAYRLDRYYEEGTVTTPKIGASWDVGYGLKFRGAWGKAFRAPRVGETSAYSVQIEGENIAAGEPSNVFFLNCNPVPNQPNNPAAANPGSLNAYLNPTCTGLINPGGIDVAGGAGASAPIRTGAAVAPEDAKSWSVGFNFAPTDPFLAGLNLDVGYYHLRINGLIDSRAALDPNDPRNVLCTAAGANCNYIVRANPNLPITDAANATFLKLVNAIVANPRATVNDITNLQYIRDGAVTNLGWRELSGIDFSARYDFSLEDFGDWNVGITGDYRLTDKNLPSIVPGITVVDSYAGNTGGRLRWRGRLGWANMKGLSVVSFVNFTPHSAPADTLPPDCFWAPGFGPGSCYPGSPYWGPYDRYPLYSPGTYTIDLTMAYNTGTLPANAYLQNLNLSLTVINLFNRAGAFDYSFGSGRGEAADQTTGNGLLQRVVQFTVSKNW